ncbi:GIY-YIG nuclease family protein [Olleya marilimosa]|uniref:GIY-YIG nuclease family protein n=1 Tax=Olleya marilimosa TaxID=272164 RepID=UPI0030ED4236|tara:strand:- start:101763 stop:102254 length:492 start_codon:yes stop_codon:yes gene_type:complete
MKHYSYLIKETNTGIYKIGKSINPLQRFDRLRVANIHIELVGISTSQEKELHTTYDKYRVSGEWFDFTSSSSTELEVLNHFKPYDEVYGTLNDNNRLECTYDTSILTKEFIDEVNYLNLNYDKSRVKKLMRSLDNKYTVLGFQELLRYQPFEELCNTDMYLSL